MKELPILFAAPMVRGIIEDRKGRGESMPAVEEFETVGKTGQMRGQGGFARQGGKRSAFHPTMSSPNNRFIADSLRFCAFFA